MTAQTIYSYYYRIRDKQTGLYYSGSKYGKNANPETFWIDGGYFTSSNQIKDLIECFGKDRFEVCKIVRMKNAHSFETRFLRRIDAQHHPLFMNAHNNKFGDENPMENEKIKNRVIAKMTATKNDPKWKDTVGSEATRKMLEKRDHKAAGQKISKTKNDPEWKLAIGNEAVVKMTATKNDPGWKETTGKEAVRKRLENQDWEKQKQTLSETLNDPEWRETMGVQKIENFVKTITSEEWKKQNYIVCEHCNNTFRPAMYKRWHGDNCKNKK